MKSIEDLRKESRILEEAGKILSAEPEMVPSIIKRFKKEIEG